jgi:hypothetical protein
MPKNSKEKTPARNTDTESGNRDEPVEDPESETATPPGPPFKDEPKGSGGQQIPGKPISDMDPPGQDEPAGLE